VSLFICDKCRCVDNTNCNEPPYNEAELDKNYPNLCGMEMYGFDLEYEKTGIRSQRQLLCSECNTGKWHGEFAKEKATEAEIIMGSQLEGDEHNVFTFHPLWNEYDKDSENFDIKALKSAGVRGKKGSTRTRYIIEKAFNETMDGLCGYSDMKPYVREEPKIGRNDECPCGSGRKYKKCCMKRGE